MTLTYEKVRIDCSVNLKTLIGLDMIIKANTHGVLEVVGVAEEETAFSELEKQLEGGEITVWNFDGEGNREEEPVFCGLIKDTNIWQNLGVYMIGVRAVTGTAALDVEIKSRSFQDVEMSYADVVKETLKDTKGAAAICTIGKDRKIEKPLIQYRETDWEFIKRIASHMNGGVVPDCRTPKAWFWFGAPDDGGERIFSELCYEAHTDERYYEMGGAAAGYRKGDFFHYDVEDPGNYAISDRSTFRGKQLYICEKRARFVSGELIFTYKLAKKSFMDQRMWYNEKITGISLPGTVVKTDHELVNIHLDIDGDKQGITYPYYWVPTSGNLMYCMPKLGTRASLHIPGHDEKEARATNSPRVNGEQCPEFGEVQNRAFTSEHGKRMHLYPELLRFMGTSDTQTPLQVVMSDPEAIVFESHKIFQMIARNGVRFEAEQASQFSPTKICAVRVAGAYVLAEEIKPKGTHSITQGTFQMPQAGPGSIDGVTSFNAENQFDLSANNNGVMQGSVYIAYAPFDDAPKKGHLNWGKLLGNVVAGLAVVGAVALTLATFGAGAAVVGAACVAGTIMVGAKAVSDIATGNVSDTWEYMLAGLAGAVSGAIGEALAGVLGVAKMAGLIKYATVGLSGGIEATVENTILGKETTFGDFLSSAIISGVSYGILDNVFRGAKRLFGSTANETIEEVEEQVTKELVQDTSQQATKELVEETTEQTAKEFAEEATEHTPKELLGESADCTAKNAVDGTTENLSDAVPEKESFSSFGEMSEADGKRYRTFWEEVASGEPRWGERPNPEMLLSQEEINIHLANFDFGGSYLVTEKTYSNFIEDNIVHPTLGRPGELFITTTDEIDRIFAEANGDYSIIEKTLGFDSGTFSNGGGLVRIDIDYPFNYDIRIPSGNEYGANAHFIFGGKTDGGVLEAVINNVPNDDLHRAVTHIKLN